MKTTLLIALLVCWVAAAVAAEPRVVSRHTFEAATATLTGGADSVADAGASGGSLISLNQPGQGIQFTRVPQAGKLAIRYASVSAGTISVTINDQPPRKVNVHSSGALTNSFLNAIIELAIPPDATLGIMVGTNDAGVNIDRIMVGSGDLGLPPDIWNLPPLPVAAGPYAPDWKALSRGYTVPEWWRDAKFGAWSHWDPQSMPEQGDWYARGMYMEGSRQYNHHVRNFGHPSEYGYKDICQNWVIDRWNPEELMNLFVEMGARFFMAMGFTTTTLTAGIRSISRGTPSASGRRWTSLALGKRSRFGLMARPARQRTCPRKVVAEVTGLAPGQHSIAIVNLGPGPVAVDALFVR